MRIVTLALLVSVVLDGPAAAARFLDVAATDDGGAWLITEKELWRVTPDGERTQVSTPALGRFQAVAATDGSLWLLTDSALATRERDGKWSSVELHRTLAAFGISPLGITPLADGRVLVLRACTKSVYDCSEAVVIDRDRVVATSTFDWSIEPAVVDGRGGAWAVVHRGRDFTREVAYAHFDGTTWRSWSVNGTAIDGMTNAGKTPASPNVALVGDDGGFVGADDDQAWFVDKDGGIVRVVVFPRTGPLRPRTDPARNHTLCAMGDDRELDVVQGYPLYDPNIRRLRYTLVMWRYDRAHASAHFDDIEVPESWHHAHTGAPLLWCSAAAGVRWVASEDAVFRGDADSWRTFDAPPAETAETAPTRTLLSIPVGLGTSTGSHVAADLRPEFVFVPKTSHPAFGIGVFAELASASRATFLGGGVTAVAYHDKLGVAVSAGVDARFGTTTEPQLVFSGFVGLRRKGLLFLPSLDTPFGIRVDVRPATHEVPATVSVMADADLLGIGLGALMVGAGGFD